MGEGGCFGIVSKHLLVPKSSVKLAMWIVRSPLNDSVEEGELVSVGVGMSSGLSQYMCELSLAILLIDDHQCNQFCKYFDLPTDFPDEIEQVLDLEPGQALLAARAYGSGTGFCTQHRTRIRRSRPHTGYGCTSTRVHRGLAH